MLHVDLQAQCSSDEQVAQAAEDAATKLQHGGVLASGVQRTLYSDYSPDVLVLSNPMSFPYGAGAQPPSWSRNAYHTNLALRYPSALFGGNPNLILQMSNMQQRHAVNATTAVNLRINPADMAAISKLSVHEVQKALTVIATGTLKSQFVALPRRNVCSTLCFGCGTPVFVHSC